MNSTPCVTPAGPGETRDASARIEVALDNGAQLHQRIGQLTRTLHDALHLLGYDRSISEAASALPDARDRLAYIGALTGQAAERVLTAVEQAQAQQGSLAQGAAALLAEWGARGAANDALPGRTREFLRETVRLAEGTQQQLHAIMMAQDFHDLSGQVIKRIGEIARMVETSLVALLVDTMPAASREDPGTLSGPAIHKGPDTVSSQREVDDLLASLGF